MPAKAFKELSDEDLAARINELRESLFNLRVRNTTRELSNYAQLASEKRELARALTIQNERRRTAHEAQA